MPDNDLQLSLGINTKQLTQEISQIKSELSKLTDGKDLGSEFTYAVKEASEYASKLSDLNKRANDLTSSFLSLGEHFSGADLSANFSNIAKDASKLVSELKAFEGEMGRTSATAGMFGMSDSEIEQIDRVYADMGDKLERVYDILSHIAQLPVAMEVAPSEEDRLNALVSYYNNLLDVRNRLSNLPQDDFAGDTTGTLTEIDRLIEKYSQLLVEKGKLSNAPAMPTEDLEEAKRAAEGVETAFEGMSPADAEDVFLTGSEKVVEDIEGIETAFDNAKNDISGSSPADAQDIFLGGGAEQAESGISGIISKITEAKEELSELEQFEKDVLSGKEKVTDDDWLQLQKDIQAANDKLSEGQQELDAYTNKLLGVKTNSEQASVATDLFKRALSGLGSLLSSIGKAAVNAFKKVLSTLKSVAATIKNSVIKAFNRVKSSMEKAFSGKAMKRNLTTLLKYTLGVRSLYFAFRKLRSAVQEGINNLVQFESETNLTNQRMTEFKTSLLFLKNAWGAAFAPIINVVMPILNILIDMLASVGNAIARFIAALTGQATVFQALKVSAGDYAKTLKGAGGSAKKAADEQKKLNDRLAAFDDLNVLGKDKDEDEDKSPAGGGGGGALTPDPNDMFERINTPFSKLADMLKQAWATGDAFELGKYIGENLKQSLTDLNTWLLTEGRAKFLKMANIIGTFIDGFISVNKLAHVIGSLLGNAIVLGIDFIDTIVTPDRFYRIGEFIVEGVNAFIPKVVPKLGELFGNLLHSAISLAYGFISDADFVGWGKAIGTSIRNFFGQMLQVNEETGLTGWQELGASLSEGAIGLIDMIIATIDSLNPVQIRMSIEQFLEKIDWEAIRDKLGELFGTVWEFIDEDMLPDIDLSVVEEIFTNLSTGVSNFSKAIESVDWEPMLEGLRDISEFISQIDWKGFASLAAFFAGIVGISKVLTILTPIGKVIGTIAKEVAKLPSLLTKIPVILTNIGNWLTWASEILTEITGVGLGGWLVALGEIKLAFDAISVGIREMSQGIGDIILNWGDFSEGKATGEAIAEAVFGGVAAGWDNLTAGWTGVSDTFKEGGLFGDDGVFALLHASYEEDEGYLNEWASAHEDAAERSSNAVGDFQAGWDVLKGTFAMMRDDFTNGLTAIGDKFLEFRDSAHEIWETLKDKFEGWKTAISTSVATLRDNVADKINLMKTAFTEWKDSILEKVTIVGDKFTEIKDTFAQIWTAIKDDFVQKKDEIVEAISNIVDGFLGIPDAIADLPERLRGIFNNVIDVINPFLSNLSEGSGNASSILSSIAGAAGGAFSTVVSAVHIPHLAQGAVIPPNREFMAVLGDQSHGTNVEAPLDTIKQAVAEVLNGNGNAEVIALLQQLISVVQSKNLTIGDREIGKANARYEAEQKLIKGTMI